MHANISVHKKQKRFRLFVACFPGSPVRKTLSATCTSDHQTKQTNSGGEHSDSTVPMQHLDTKANDETATYLSDFDFFELTASQENYLFKEMVISDYTRLLRDTSFPLPPFIYMNMILLHSPQS